MACQDCCTNDSCEDCPGYDGLWCSSRNCLSWGPKDDRWCNGCVCTFDQRSTPAPATTEKPCVDANPKVCSNCKKSCKIKCKRQDFRDQCNKTCRVCRP